jgi:hypothetical protein
MRRIVAAASPDHARKRGARTGTSARMSRRRSRTPCSRLLRPCRRRCRPHARGRNQRLWPKRSSAPLDQSPTQLLATRIRDQGCISPCGGVGCSIDLAARVPVLVHDRDLEPVPARLDRGGSTQAGPAPRPRHRSSSPGPPQPRLSGGAGECRDAHHPALRDLLAGWHRNAVDWTTHSWQTHTGRTCRARPGDRASPDHQPPAQASATRGSRPHAPRWARHPR